MTAPRVSVILATYDWSSVLRFSIASVLGQTFEDFELLVIGDACTDDSADVVRSFADPRARWLNLLENSGSQVGPNNAGLAAARGEYVAYLGQDDLWFPTHLGSLVQSLDSTGADLACAVAILYGPPGSGIRAVTGLWDPRPGESLRPVPPSSLMHRRNVATLIGPWKDHRTIGLPPDYEFLVRVWEHRQAFARTEQLTVFKFTATWRPDAYQIKNADEQAQCLHRMGADPNFRVRELMDVVSAYAAGKSIEIVPPPDAPPGASVARAKVFKGVNTVLSPEDRTDRLRFDFDQVLPGFEWHGIEHDERFGTFQWSGPGTRASLDLPLACDRDLNIVVRILHAVVPDVLESLRLEVNDEPIPLARHAEETGTTLFDGFIPAGVLAGRRGPARLAFHVDRTVEPRAIDPSSGDRRRLGLAFNWIEICPAAAEPAASPDARTEAG